VIEPPSHTGCPFCDYLNGVERCAFISQNDAVSSFLNRAEFERGATLVVPNVHLETILQLDANMITQLYCEAQRIARGMVQAFRAVGVNVFHNSGVRAGQSVSHLHVHVVPRYETSKPWQRFRESELERTPIDELEVVANELRVALSA
jgi:histidine triad (HIT) family protein